MNELSATARRFILHWGEMGARWGVNRTVAQVHALLFLSPAPLNADEICERLGVARSNASGALRELQNWNLVRVVHLMNDRKDHFETERDVSEMFRIIVAERRRREIDPTLRMLREVTSERGRVSAEELAERGQLESLRQFFELVTQWTDQVQRVPTPALVKAARLGDKAFRILGLTAS